MAADDTALASNATGRRRARASGPAAKTATWWDEAKGIAWLVLAVLGFHSFVAKPFYIPSESMLPGLLVGDRLVVTKYPYGWSYVSPTIPNPVAIFRSLVLRQPQDSWGAQLPFVHGRLLGHLPERGDVVIVTPPNQNSDYIKRVIGLPGDTLEVRGGQVILNGAPVKRGPIHTELIPVDANSTCDETQYGVGAIEQGAEGRLYCRLPIVTETLPNGRSYDTVDLQPNSEGDNYPALKIPAGHVFLMGDNRDRSADSRFPADAFSKGLGGAVPWENLGGRAEFITFSLDGHAGWNPLKLPGSFRPGRAGTSLHAQRVTPVTEAAPDMPTPDMVVEPSPGETRDPLVRAEIKKAVVWFSIAGAIALVVLLVQPLLIIFGGLVFAAMLEGGVRLLGRVLPIGRGWRLAIVMLSAVLFVIGTFYLTGVQLTQQFSQLQETLILQANRLAGWAQSKGIMPGMADIGGLARQALGSVGRLTSFVGTAAGALTSLFMIVVLGLFVAMEPRLYDRGLQWMVPLDHRSAFAATMEEMGTTLRRLLAGRLLGMLFEGVLTFIVLVIFGVPMALVLGIIAAILAFIPNVGAFITGLLMVAVGLSAGLDKGLAAFATYIVVQTFDGYVVLPMVARKTVDVPPALTLGAQLLASTLFGILGLALADPMVAMIKVALERRSKQAARDGFGVDTPRG